MVHTGAVFFWTGYKQWQRGPHEEKKVPPAPTYRKPEKYVKNFTFAVISIVGFIAANTAWLISLRTGAELGKGAILFSVLSAIGAVVLTIFLYHEKVTPYQYIGLLLGIAAIVFLSIE
jgi:drug/metabolite transporter (DMT)-like permease